MITSKHKTASETPMMMRGADLRPSSFDETENTVEATITTFAGLERRDAGGAFIERLDPAGLDASRLIGAPVLDGHKQGSARDSIGVITAFRHENNSLVATIRLLKSDDVKPIVDRIRQGIVRGVSVGYRVLKWTDSVDPKTKTRMRTAASWSIMEVSAVPVPADAGATFRGANMEENNVAEVEPTAVETRAEIRKIARAAGLSVEWADARIDANATVTETRAAAFEEIQRRSAGTPHIRTFGGNDNPDVIFTRREGALLARVCGTAPKAEERQYMSDTLRDIARGCVEANGISTRGMDTEMLFRAALHSTSDFPNLLTGVGRRVLLQSYEAAGSPLKSVLARQSTLPDFRKGTKLKISDIGLLQKVNEHGEIKGTTRTEATESYALDTYGAQYGLTRKALINDDLGAFRDWAATAGRMAAQTENNLLFTMFRSNSGAGPTMGEDSVAMFHANHGNLAGSGTALDETNVSAARLAMRGFKALDGKTVIGVTPKYLLVGSQLETTVEKLLASIYAATTANANPFTGKLEPLIEPLITDKSWYVFADPAAVPVIEYSYLSGAAGPQMASREGWDILGQEYRVFLDFGCGPVDWRGAYRNPGL